MLGLNTFGLDATCDALWQPSSAEQLAELLTNSSEPPNRYFVMGGGSNLLFVDHLPKIVIHPRTMGVEYFAETADNIKVRVGAGENWHQLVLDAVAKGYWGLENLSLIPGNVGAAPIQNIGAYGVELKDVFVSLRAMRLSDATVVAFDHQQCQFDYRHSVFKGEEANQFVILDVTMELSKRPRPRLEYGALKMHPAVAGKTDITPEMISQAVCEIRRSKLPDPEVLGNAGSFFKNPVVSQDQHQELQARHPKLVSYPLPDGSFKLAAGWLIDQLGLKGHRVGDAGVHSQQALVLVNHGSATGAEIHALALEVQRSVAKAYDVVLEPEVRVLP